MAKSVDEFKKEWEDKIRTNPSEYGAKEADNVTVSFASDSAIQKHLDGSAAGIIECCLVVVEVPLLGKKCAVPPGADPNNKCL